MNRPLSGKFLLRKRENITAFLFSDAPYWFVNKDRLTAEINHSILNLCDGRHYVKEIISFVGENLRFNRSEAMNYVMNFLNTLEKAGALVDDPSNKAKLSPVINLPIPKTPHLAQGSIVLTQACNLRCKHCAVEAGAPLPNELTKEEIYSLMETFIQLMKARKEIVFTGGEPFLRKNLLFNLLDFADSLGYQRILLLTNGTLIDSLTIDNLVEFNEHFKRDKDRFKDFVIQISVEGYKEMHEWIRGKGTWEKTVNAVKALANTKITTSISMVVQKENFQDVPKVLQLAHRIGVSVGFSSICLTGRALKNKMQIIPIHKIVPILRSFMEKNPGYCKQVMQFPCSPYIITLRKLIRFKYCGTGWTTVYTDSNGDVYPCPLSATIPEKKFKAGNIREQPFLEIWRDSSVLKNLRAFSVDNINEKCAKCDVRYFCGGGCRTEAFLEGDIKGCSPKCHLGEYRNMVWECIWLLAQFPQLYQEMSNLGVVKLLKSTFEEAEPIYNPTH
jgi:radical SAM protein with 4Fe4S-binding SPASM domain